MFSLQNLDIFVFTVFFFSFYQFVLSHRAKLSHFRHIHHNYQGISFLFGMQIEFSRPIFFSHFIRKSIIFGAFHFHSSHWTNENRLKFKCNTINVKTHRFEHKCDCLFWDPWFEIECCMSHLMSMSKRDMRTKRVTYMKKNRWCALSFLCMLCASSTWNEWENSIFACLKNGRRFDFDFIDIIQWESNEWWETGQRCPWSSHIVYDNLTAIQCHYTATLWLGIGVTGIVPNWFLTLPWLPQCIVDIGIVIDERMWIGAHTFVFTLRILEIDKNEQF